MKNTVGDHYNRESQILLVEDDGEILKFLKIHLNRFFAKITAVNTSNAAIKALKEREIDLVISDYNLPNFNGYELLQKIKRRDPSISFLFITGELLSAQQEAQLSDADGLLRKPFSVEKLHEFISVALGKREIKKDLCQLLGDKKLLPEVLAEPESAAKHVGKEQLPETQKLLRKLAGM
jgi:CheY-like chemotaxis protein